MRSKVQVSFLFILFFTMSYASSETTTEPPSGLGIFGGVNEYFDCPPGLVLVTIRRGAIVHYICTRALFPFFNPINLFPKPAIYVPPTPILAYRAGVCAKNLSNLPIRIGQIRHDDIESYHQDGLARFDELTSGFYAIDESSAILNALLFIANGRSQDFVFYTPGEVRHSTATTFSCVPPMVSEETYKKYRTLVKTEIWIDYHLFERNCLHWAEHIDNLALN